MTVGTGLAQAGDTRFEPVWRVPQAWVESGRIPGYVAAVRIGGRTALRAGGRTAIGASGAPMGPEALFRIASVTKPIGAALALRLARDGVLGLDDPIARWLPEAAAPRVLVSPDAPLERTTAVERLITVRHLLTMTSGWGAVLEPTPLQAAMFEREVYPAPLPRQITADEYVAGLTGLPLVFQPGRGWLYDTGLDLLGVLLARATGTPLSRLLAEYVTGPLGMTSTGFWTRGAERLTTAYRPGPAGLEVLDPADGRFSAPPAMETLSGGLVSTASDLLRFFCAMADGGSPVLGADEVALLTSDALTDLQRTQALPILGPGASWGLGVQVDLEAAEPWMTPGRWGWSGGTGTSAYVDPTRGTVSVLLTQRAMSGPLDGHGKFWTAVAAVA